MISFIYINTESEELTVDVKKNDTEHITCLSWPPTYRAHHMNKITILNAFIDGEMSAAMPSSFKMENTTLFSDFVT